MKKLKTMIASERRERDRNPPCDEPCAHSSVHSSGSVLLWPAAMNLEPRIASAISTAPISTERGVVSQPSSRARRGRRGRPVPAATGCGPGLQREDLLGRLEERPAGRRGRRRPAVPGVLAPDLGRVEVHEREVGQVAQRNRLGVAHRRDHAGLRPRRARARGAPCRTPGSRRTSRWRRCRRAAPP